MDFRDDLQFALEDSSAVTSMVSVASSLSQKQLGDPTYLVALGADYGLDAVGGSSSPPVRGSTPLAIGNGSRQASRPSPALIFSSGDGGGRCPPGLARPRALSSSLVDKRIALYKTEICRAFEETGICRYGNRCQFAHHPGELRMAPRHPRYKTEICRTYWEKGTCPYGKRCCFIHNELSGASGASLSHSFGGRLDMGTLSLPSSAVGGESKILKRLERLTKTPREEDMWAEELESHQHLTVDMLQMMDE